MQRTYYIMSNTKHIYDSLVITNRANSTNSVSWDATCWNLEYSLNNYSWHTPTITDDKAQVNFNGLIFLRANSSQDFINNTYTGRFNGNTITISNSCDVAGNIAYLIDYQAKAPTEPKLKAFNDLFACDPIVNAKDLVLMPLAEADDEFYKGMFAGCSSLITTPVLPTNSINYLPSEAFYDMFMDCTSLVQAPEIPYAQIGPSGCSGMFEGCTSLTTVPDLNAERISEYSYTHMFSGCTSLVTPPAIKALRYRSDSPAQYVSSGFSYMFNGCTSLTKLPKLYFTRTVNSDSAAHTTCKNMFSGCTKIKMSATQTGEYVNAYPLLNITGEDMFKNTGGTYTGDGNANTIYYTSNEIIE